MTVGFPVCRFELYLEWTIEGDDGNGCIVLALWIAGKEDSRMVGVESS